MASQGKETYMLPLSWIYLTLQQYDKAIAWGIQAYNHGDSAAAKYLGDIFDSKDNPKHDVNEAESWYRKAADGGDSDALMICAKHSFYRLEFDSVLADLIKVSVIQPEEVIDFLCDKLLPVKALSKAHRQVAEELLSGCMAAVGTYGERGVCGTTEDGIEELIEQAKSGVESAIASLCRTIEVGYGGIIVSKVRPAAETGEEWACRIMGAAYYRQGYDESNPYMKAMLYIKAIKMGHAKAFRPLLGIVDQNTAARQCLVSSLNESIELKLLFEAAGIDPFVILNSPA